MRCALRQQRRPRASKQRVFVYDSATEVPQSLALVSKGILMRSGDHVTACRLIEHIKGRPTAVVLKMMTTSTSNLSRSEIQARLRETVANEGWDAAW